MAIASYLPSQGIKLQTSYLVPQWRDFEDSCKRFIEGLICECAQGRLMCCS